MIREYRRQLAGAQRMATLARQKRMEADERLMYTQSHMDEQATTHRKQIERLSYVCGGGDSDDDPVMLIC